MQSERLGVITFFGILIPGSYLSGVFLLSIASFLVLTKSGGHWRLFELMSNNAVFSSLSFFFISYLLGVVLRLFAPSQVDSLSEYYLEYIRRKKNRKNQKNRWVKDVFPYKETLTSALESGGMAKIPKQMEKLNKTYGNENNTIFFNYCKLFIDTNDPALSRQVQEAEALVRFLSGTTLALIVTVLITLFFFIIFLLCGIQSFCVAHCGIMILALLCLILILERFKYQRRREVAMVWSCVYLILNKTYSNKNETGLKYNIDDIFFPDGTTL